MKPESVGLMLGINFGKDNKRSCALYPEFCFDWMRGGE